MSDDSELRPDELTPTEKADLRNQIQEASEYFRRRLAEDAEKKRSENTDPPEDSDSPM